MYQATRLGFDPSHSQICLLKWSILSIQLDGMDQDNQVEKTEKLLAEPTTEGAELDDYHPCEVRASTKHLSTDWWSGIILLITSSTAQGGGGSFKNRKPIGEIGCCESGTERCLRSPLFLSLSLTIYLPTSLSSMYLSIYRSIYLSLSLFLSFI